MSIKTISVGLAMMVGVAFTYSPALAKGFDSTDTVSRQTLEALSVDEHRRLADSAKATFEDLESQIQKVQARIDKLSQKPHLDTKGFKRQGLRLWKGKLVNELREAANKMVWHKTQAKDMLASRDKQEQDS
ncbi:MAG: hypothetical protein MRJ96_00605 [Nitrospirales bacterium]|nr:hypothetical protein [Nitrospira sp.]MDR4499940.1 hypothetical protein [Nitrospirales bacterium]